MVDEKQSLNPTSYTVVARRYRPRSFSELIGQGHVAQALSKAIETGRVGHAYLFTGARGVGKTSAARIFAKALNAPEGAIAATTNPSDIAQAIDAGEDIDVIEIDGASNRGIEEIRQLRANVNMRPSRARFKIYIIDEVHMLTNQAFNALLKTLEEPPEHVKFIFCTTDPDKIPITVLSRCQRFDFVPVKFEAIQKRLKEIAIAEGFQVDDEALGLLARKAAGSMRDSQSLLEQVMSFSTESITVDQVHALLGTADESRLQAVAEALRDKSALQAFSVADEAIRAGSDPGQLAEQLLNYFRDVLAVGIGGGPELLKLANPAGFENLKKLANDWGVQTILSAIQILDESLVRMRASVSSTTLLEVALVQICQLHEVASIPALLEALAQGGPLPAATPKAVPPAVKQVPPAPATTPPKADEKKNGEVTQAEVLQSNATYSELVERSKEVVASPVLSQEESDIAVAEVNSIAKNQEPLQSGRVGSSHALDEWQKALQRLDGMLADYASLAVSVEPQGSDHWVVIFPPGSTQTKQYCDVPERRVVLQKELADLLGRSIRLTFEVQAGSAPKESPAAPPTNLRVQKIREYAAHPLIKKVVEVLDGEIVRVDSPTAT